MKALKSRTVGVALSETQIVLRAGIGARDAPTRPFERAWAVDDPTRRQALVDVLREMRKTIVDASAMSIVLLPPLAEIRFVHLPPLPPDELRSAVARDIMRYAPVSTAPHVVQVQAVNDRPVDVGVSRLISIAEEGLIEDVLVAARDAGWHVKSIAAAAFAWESAARSKAGEDAEGWISVRTERREDSLRLGMRGIVGARRFSPPRAILAPEDTVLAEDLSAALILAASHAVLPDVQSLWPDRVYLERAKRRWREVRGLVITSAALLVLAIGIESFSMSRQESRVANERAAIRSELAIAVERRDTLMSLQRTLATIHNFEAGSPSWISLLGSIEAALPPDAFLISLRGIDDSVTMIGEAERAAPVIDALSRAAVFRAVRAAAPIDQLIEDGEVVAERFSILGLQKLGTTPR